MVIMPTTRAVQRLEMHERAMTHAHAIAKVYSWSDSVPEQYSRSSIDSKTGQPQGDKATYNATIAILHGASLGLNPDAALENIFMIKGKPATYARLMVALVNRWVDERIAVGRTTADPEAGDKIWEVESGPTKCVWAGRRDGITKYSEWDIGRATTAGYTSNKLYNTIPEQMLTAKAQAEVCRIVFPDVILGLSHSIEELRLEDGVSVQRVVKKQDGVRGAAALREIAAQAQEPQPAPEPVPEPAPEPPKEPGPTKSQFDEITKLYEAQGITGAEMLADVALFLQREGKLRSLRSLSEEDVEAVLAHLRAAK